MVLRSMSLLRVCRRWCTCTEGWGAAVSRLAIQPNGAVVTGVAACLLLRRGVLVHARHAFFSYAAGLEHCHSRNVVHLDVKAENVLVCCDGVSSAGSAGSDDTGYFFGKGSGPLPPDAVLRSRGPKRVVLIDFGLGNTYPNPKKDPFTVLRGTKPYKSPEVRMHCLSFDSCLLRDAFGGCLCGPYRWSVINTAVTRWCSLAL